VSLTHTALWSLALIFLRETSKLISKSKDLLGNQEWRQIHAKGILQVHRAQRKKTNVAEAQFQFWDCIGPGMSCADSPFHFFNLCFKLLSLLRSWKIAHCPYEFKCVIYRNLIRGNGELTILSCRSGSALLMPFHLRPDYIPGHTSGTAHQWHLSASFRGRDANTPLCEATLPARCE
jgi:hypothetical protein